MPLGHVGLVGLCAISRELFAADESPFERIRRSATVVVYLVQAVASQAVRAITHLGNGPRMCTVCCGVFLEIGVAGNASDELVSFRVELSVGIPVTGAAGHVSTVSSVAINTLRRTLRNSTVAADAGLVKGFALICEV